MPRENRAGLSFHSSRSRSGSGGGARLSSRRARREVSPGLERLEERTVLTTVPIFVGGKLLTTDASNLFLGTGATLIQGGNTMHGILTINPKTAGTFTYAPDPGYHGPDSFTYHYPGQGPNNP